MPHVGTNYTSRMPKWESHLTIEYLVVYVSIDQLHCMFRLLTLRLDYGFEPPLLFSTDYLLKKIFSLNLIFSPKAALEIQRCMMDTNFYWYWWYPFKLLAIFYNKIFRERRKCFPTFNRFPNLYIYNLSFILLIS